MWFCATPDILYCLVPSYDLLDSFYALVGYYLLLAYRKEFGGAIIGLAIVLRSLLDLS